MLTVCWRGAGWTVKHGYVFISQRKREERQAQHEQFMSWEQSLVINLIKITEFEHCQREMCNCIKCNWPRHDLPSFRNKKGQTECEAPRHPVHFWKAAQGQKQWGVHPRDSFREQQWVGGEWKDNIIKKTQTGRGRKRERARRRRRVIRDQGDPAPLRNMFCL